MEFLNHLREKAAVQKIEKFIPAIAFLGGFSWDSMTIGSKVYGSDLIFLSFYYLLALVSIFFIASPAASMTSGVLPSFMYIWITL